MSDKEFSGAPPDMKERGHHIETEVKIIRLKEEDKDPEQFLRKIDALGGTLTIPRRLLVDQNVRTWR